MQTRSSLDPRLEVITGSANTTDATLTTIANIPVDEGGTTLATVNLIGTWTGGSAGSNLERLGAIYNCCLKKVSGVIYLNGSASYSLNSNPYAWGGLDVTTAVLQATQPVKVGGAANKNISWKVKIYLLRS